MLARTARCSRASSFGRDAAFEQGFDRGADAVDDGAKVWGVAFGGTAEFFQGREDGAAAGVAEDHHELGAESLGRELDAADLGGGHDVAGHPDHEEVAEALVEDDLGGHPRVGTAEDDRERVVRVHEFLAAGLVDERIGSRDAVKKRRLPSCRRESPSAGEIIFSPPHSGVGPPV